MESNEVPANNGKIQELFKQVKDLYSMNTDIGLDTRINILLSGLNSIVSSITEMRNNNSDAHGIGPGRISIEDHHARLAVKSFCNDGRIHSLGTLKEA